MEEQEGKWDRLERERLQIRPETLTQLELLAQALRTDTVDEAVRTLLSTQTFALHTKNMVETLQHAWQMNDPLEVVTRLARQAMDQLERDQSLLVLLSELEASGVTDPVAYLRGLVREKEEQRGEALVAYERLPYSHLVGVETPGAMKERWRRAIMAIMWYNVGCRRVEDCWFINEWAILALVGGLVQPLSRYLQEVEPMLRAHHHKFDLHPNVNRKDLTIADEVPIDEEPPSEDLWRNLGLQAKNPNGDE